MDLVKFKRDQEQYRDHIQRVRNITPVLDSSTPESLGLKHLELRPKKMQLIEDRRQAVAKENAKLMSLMTSIMNEKREQPKYSKPVSLNEPHRKRIVDRVNFENDLMVSRLKKVTSVISNDSFEQDFKKHLKAESHLRRRQMKPLAVPKGMYKGSPMRSPGRSHTGASTEGEGMGMFDSSLYTAQRSGPLMAGSGLEQFSSIDISSSPIRSVADFRKQVVATKKLHSATASGAGLSSSLSPPEQQYQQQKVMSRPYHPPDQDSLFELHHVA